MKPKTVRKAVREATRFADLGFTVDFWRGNLDRRTKTAKGFRAGNERFTFDSHEATQTAIAMKLYGGVAESVKRSIEVALLLGKDCP